MDPDEQTPPALTESQTEDGGAPSSDPAGRPPSAAETGMDTVSRPTDESTEPLANISKCLFLERSSSSDCLKPSSSSGSEPAQKEEDLRDQGYFDSSETISPLLPHLSHDSASPSSDLYSQFESTPDVPSALESLMGQPDNEPLCSFSSVHSPDTYLSRSLSHESDSLESDTAAAAMTDLYIFESETQDFILSSAADPREIKNPVVLQPEGEVDDCDDSAEAVNHHGGRVKEVSELDNESDGSQQTGLSPPAVEASLMAVNDARPGREEVNGQIRQSDSPVELWLDACQYLAGEDTANREGLDRTGLPVTQKGTSASTDFSFPSEEAQVSGYYHERSEGIGWSGDDTRGWGPPVERWSSVDSWASALSDWSEIITAPPQDITAAFTEIGAEIDALTQALAEVTTYIDTGTAVGEQREETLMGVQDKPLDTQNIPQSSILSGQSCLSLRLSEETHRSRAESSPCPTEQHPPVGASGGRVASPGGYDLEDLIPGCASSPELDFGHCIKSFIDFEEDEIILNIVEDTDLVGQHAPAGLTAGQPPRDAVCEVTEEHGVSQPGSGVQQGTEVGCDEAEAPTDAVFLTKQTLTEPGLPADALTRPSVDTSAGLDGARQVEPRWGSPLFIMPLAPLRIGSSFHFRPSSYLEGELTCAKRSFNDNRGLGRGHVQPVGLWPACDGITDTPSLERDRELIKEKENTTDSVEEPSPEGQLDLYTGATEGRTIINDLSSDRSNLAVGPADHFNTDLPVDDPVVSRTAETAALSQKTAEKMPHKTHKTSENKARSKKEKPTAHHHGAQTSKKPENSAHAHVKQKETLTGENHTSQVAAAGPEEKQEKLVIEAGVAAEKTKPHGKKKKKHGQNAAGVRSTAEPLVEVENPAKPKVTKGRVDVPDAKLGVKTGKAQKDNNPSHEKKQPDVKPPQEEQPDLKPKSVSSPLSDDVIKRRRLSQDKFGKLVGVLESKLPKPGVCVEGKAEVGVGGTRKKAYSEVVKQKAPKEDPRVVQPVQAAALSGDPQSLLLWCQFTAVFTNYTVTWRREGVVLAEIKRSAGDESRVSLTISNASHKDLGKYQCCLSWPHGAVTLDYLLTYEVLSEIVIPPPPQTLSAAPVEVGTEEEDAHFSRLIFKEDFLSDQSFGENHPVSIITEKAHFGEGMHRRAFRTKLHTGVMPLLLPGHGCVLKVHTAISYGTKSNDELIQKNFTLAVEECQVQNTAREYIKAYTTEAQSVEAFGDIPEIIPIYLVHRPSNNIPYATLEEELIGDFVKYSVKDGKEINLMRRDSEAGRKCCAFQHWVYHKTDGNLLVTDMQGVGLRLTDVGIATCKKGYKGFKGNCATSFIDQFKALHQCNTYCEFLGLKSLQPKPKKPAAAPKAKPGAAAGAKKKPFGPTMKGKS